MKFGLFAGLGLICAMPVSAIASPALALCQGCTQAQQIAKAKSVGVGDVYMLDVNQNSVVALRVYRTSSTNRFGGSTDDNPARADGVATTAGAAELTADFIPAVAPYKDAAMDVGNYYNTNPRGWQKGINYPFVGNTNVYDVIDMGPRQVTFQNNIASNAIMPFLPFSIGSKLAQFAKFADASVAPKIEIHVEFSDGSSVNVTVDMSSTNPKAVVDKDSGVDSHGNPLLAHAQSINDGISHAEFGGPGNPTDEQRWKDRMTALNYVIISSGSGQSSPAHGWACVQVGSGKDAVWTCTYH